ncbi:MAG: hypothetical protein JSW71_08820 [Gemmatimonadota bacterium]|nr:MAG: hypothetical protein JSW71_08820 [Gemmatimonadota bacterium]
MSAELGGSQLSSLLETVPGLASVLRSPVADAIVNMIRAGAGLGDFSIQDAQELIQYATRRGLIPSAEGSELLHEIEAVAGKRRSSKKTAKRSASKKRVAKPATSKAATKHKGSKKKTAKKTAKRAAKKAPKRATKATKKRR